MISIMVTLSGFKDLSDGRVIVLPCDFTKIKLHADYCIAAEAAGWRVVSKTVFQRVWRQLFPRLIISKPKTDLCWTCQQNNLRFIR